ncbi:MAG: rubredoxin [Dehalococcoidales bacterium]
MSKYECTVCGYVYDPEMGDPEGGIAPGTPFEELPEDWVKNAKNKNQLITRKSINGIF